MNKQNIKSTKEGTVFHIKVIPKAHRSEVVKWENGELKIRVAAVADKGEANDELIRYLADFLDVSKSEVHIVQGHTSRHKRICITNSSFEKIQSFLSTVGQ